MLTLFAILLMVRVLVKLMIHALLAIEACCARNVHQVITKLLEGNANRVLLI